MPTITIIAGPNGAGKTSFASEYLTGSRSQPFVNADEIVREVSASEDRPSDVRADRIMLERVAELVRLVVDFALETTLATLTCMLLGSRAGRGWDMR